MIAGEVGLPEDQIRGMFLAGLIHDVGKINIPAGILSKLGKLTRLEMQFIRTIRRPATTSLMASSFPGPLRRILQYHERLDGSGYLRGLAAEAVFVEARILAVARGDHGGPPQSARAEPGCSAGRDRNRQGASLQPRGRRRLHRIVQEQVVRVSMMRGRNSRGLTSGTGAQLRRINSRACASLIDGSTSIELLRSCTRNRAIF